MVGKEAFDILRAAMLLGRYQTSVGNSFMVWRNKSGVACVGCSHIFSGFLWVSSELRLGLLIRSLQLQLPALLSILGEHMAAKIAVGVALAVVTALGAQSSEQATEKLYTVCSDKKSKGVALFADAQLQNVQKKLKCGQEVTALGPGESYSTRVRATDGLEGYILSEKLSQDKDASNKRIEAQKQAEAQAKAREKEELRSPPQVTINAPVDVVKAALAGYYLRNGFQIGTETSYQVSVWSELKGGQAILTQALLGNAYSDTPRQMFTFMLAPTGNATTVTAEMEVSVRMLLGNVNRVSMTTNKNWRPGMQSVLESLKNSIESEQSARAVSAPVAAPSNSPAPELTVVEIYSTPAGADIELDGAFVGNTPSTVKVKEGDHALVLTKKGFAPFKKSFRTLGGSVNISAELLKSE